MPRPDARRRPPLARRLRRLGLLVAVAVLLPHVAPRSALARGVPFLEAGDGLDGILRAAKALAPSRLVVVELFTERCAWCRALERETFGADDVAAALADDLCVRCDAESPAGRPIAERFGVRAFPTTLFLEPSGGEVDRLSGFVPPARFLAEAARIRAGTGTLKSLRAAHAAQPDDVGVTVAYARKLARAGDRDAARRLLDPVAASPAPDRAALPGALLGLAEIATLDGDARRADECLARLLTRHADAPEAAEGFLLQIDRLARIGAFDRAVEAAAQARGVLKDDGQLARLEELLATFERQRFEATIVRWGERADAAGDLESLARAAKAALGRRVALGTARRWAERVVRAAPDDAEAVEVCADLQFETGSPERAIRTASEALEGVKDADARARLSRRIAAWRAGLGGPPPPAPGGDALPPAPAPAALPRPTDPPAGSPPAASGGEATPSPSAPAEPRPPCR